MARYIELDALVAEIERLKDSLSPNFYEYDYDAAKVELLEKIEKFLNTFKVKEVDFDAEWKRYFEHRGEMATVNVKHLAKHFFKLGMRLNNPITAADRGMAEEIIINLKRVEKDYRINLAKEMEWLRNKVKKGE